MASVSSSSGSGTAAVQVTVEVHAASWDVRQYILGQLQQPTAAGQQQQQRQSVQAGTPSPKVFGPYAATLSKAKNKNLVVTHLQQQHEPQTYAQQLARKPHRVVLQERVPGSDPAHFKLHLKPRSKDGQAISCAGEGPGLQVAPGSVSELPADTTYPLDISLRVLSTPDGQQGQWTARVYCNNQLTSWRIQLAANHPLSAYAGRSISKMSLSQDKQLTLTFAPAAAAAVVGAAAGAAVTQAAAADASMPSPQPPKWRQSRLLPLKRSAAAASRGTRQQQTEAVEQGSGSSPARRGMSTAAAAAAVAGGTSGQTPAAVTRKKPRQTNQQQAAAAPGALPPPLERAAGQAARAQRAAGRAVMAAAAGSTPPQAAAAHKKRRQTQLQQEESPATTDAAAAAPPEHPEAPVPIKQEPGSSTPAAATNTGLMLWHMGELSSDSSSSGEETEDDSKGGAAGTASSPPPTAPAAAGPPVPVPTTTIKQEAAPGEVLDLTAADDTDTDAADAPGPAETAGPPPAPLLPPPADLLPASEEAAAVGTAATAAAAAEAAAPAAPQLLPPGVQLQDVSGPRQMEQQLVRLLKQGLRPLLPSEQYAGLLRMVLQTFVPVRRAATAEQVEQLQCGYTYVQGAVEGRQLDFVVEALEALCSGG